VAAACDPTAPRARQTRQSPRGPLRVRHTDRRPQDRQAKISTELAYVEERLNALELHYDVVEGNLRRALSFVTDIHAAYLEAPPKIRRLINQALFEKFLVSDDGELTGELRAPFDLLLRAAGTTEQRGDAHTPITNKPRGLSRPRGLSKQSLVGATGLEPVTPSLSIPGVEHPGTTDTPEPPSLRRSVVEPQS
jgi:site-specific DNA recombinase